ncbi:TRPT1, partial [Symbiodinium sp. CCMP2456]
TAASTGAHATVTEMTPEEEDERDDSRSRPPARRYKKPPTPPTSPKRHRGDAKGADDRPQKQALTKPAPPQTAQDVADQWDMWRSLRGALRSLRKSGASEHFRDFINKGNFARRHKDFHSDEVTQSLPKFGNWNLSCFAHLLLGELPENSEGTGQSATYGRAVECWIHAIASARDRTFEKMYAEVAAGLTDLMSLMDGVPTAWYEDMDWKTTEPEVGSFMEHFYPRERPDHSIRSPAKDSNKDPKPAPKGSRRDDPEEDEKVEVEVEFTEDEWENWEEEEQEEVYVPFDFGQPPPRPLKYYRDFKISKRLSASLRHDKGDFNLDFRKNMAAPLRQLLAHRIMTEERISQAEIIAVVYHNAKQRFRLLWEGGPDGELLIGAVQGHSMAVDNASVHCRVDQDKVPYLTHATHYDFYKNIAKDGLRAGGVAGKAHRAQVHCLPDCKDSEQYYPEKADVILRINP